MNELNAILETIKDDIDVINDYEKKVNKKLKENNINYKLNLIDKKHIAEQVKQSNFSKEHLQLIYRLLSNSRYSAELRTAYKEGFYDDLVTEEVDMIMDEISY